MDVMDQLDAEWRALGRSPDMLAALERWGDADPVLRFRDLDALVTRVERRDADPAATDAILSALARRAPHDRRAARVLLQLVLPGCKALVRCHPIGERRERSALVAAAAWERIRTYPIERRPTKVAANVIADVRHRLLRTTRAATWTPIERVPERLLPLVSGPERATEAIGLLAAAVRTGVIDHESARLVLLTRVVGVEMAEISKVEGTSQQTLRRRRLRAEARLRTLAAA